MFAAITATVEPPHHTSRRRWCAAWYTTSAGTSGWKIGGTGCGWSGSFVRHQSNCGVFTAGSCTIVIHTRLLRCMSSVRMESVIPRMANFAPQYAACSGMAR